YDRSIEYFKKLIEMDPNYVRTHFYLSKVYREKSMFLEALEETEKGVVLDGGKVDDQHRAALVAIVDASKRSGVKGAWQTTLEFVNEDIRKGDPPNPVDLAEIYARLGDRDKAFEWLEKVFETGDVGDLLLKVNPGWDNLRDDPRFADLLKRAGFPQLDL
ncbi:MAG TPA: hypothetical protein VJ781_02195, partial [Pyrinomonadaceae bacterium]|nr:hypothetical protein [Pyrinomonadaceae bacterium]